MFIRINPKLNWFTSDKGMNSLLLSLRGQWLKVETKHLFDNQYNVSWCGNGYRIFDTWIDRVFNDERDQSVFTSDFGGKLPEIKLFEHLLNGVTRCPVGWFSVWAKDNCELARRYLRKDFNLTFDVDFNHYTLTNCRQTNFKFVYHNGSFYEYDRHGYRKVKSLVGKVRSDQIKPLIELFADHY